MGGVEATRRQFMRKLMRQLMGAGVGGCCSSMDSLLAKGIAESGNFCAACGVLLKVACAVLLVVCC